MGGARAAGHGPGLYQMPGPLLRTPGAR
jgi:hypothetical protein